MQLYRIASARYPVWDGTGAALMGGRWNSPGKPVIYAAITYAGAMLEVLAHTNTGKIPPSHRCVMAHVPSDVGHTKLTIDDLPAGWDGPESTIALDIGDAWIARCDTPILLVPSVVARVEFNALVNPAHKDASRIQVSEPMEVRWDTRLFR